MYIRAKTRHQYTSHKQSNVSPHIPDTSRVKMEQIEERGSIHPIQLLCSMCSVHCKCRSFCGWVEKFELWNTFQRETCSENTPPIIPINHKSLNTLQTTNETRGVYCDRITNPPSLPTLSRVFLLAEKIESDSEHKEKIQTNYRGWKGVEYGLPERTKTRPWICISELSIWNN